MTVRPLLLALALPAVAVAGCGDSGGAGTPSAPVAGAAPAPAAVPVAATSPARRRGAGVRVIDSPYGRVLADGGGYALYLFTRDGRGPSRCYGLCAKAWPPLLTRGAPRALAGARSRLLGTVRRRNGRRQVTYRGQPLYYYVGDREPGQILCQDVFEFGGTWLVVAPSGRAVR